ncbi:MAG: HlyC/CorC family transporter [Clostridia bacterium]|nr:HlyC/CorC family transporter [Clostridia bacterium]
MEPGGIGIIVALAALIGCSAFFSSSETAYTTVNHTRLKALAKAGKKRAAIALDLAEDYDRLLTTILIGNNIVNILASSLATVVFIHYVGDAGVTVSTVVMTVLVLIFGEISPKTLAKDRAERWAMAFAPILRLLRGLFLPINWIFLQWKKLLSRVFPTPQNTGLAEEELLTIVEEAVQEGEIDSHESELIRSAIEFDDLSAEDILTHRVDVVALDVSMTLNEAETVFREHTFSRLPVYEGNIDDIVGIIHEKDFFNNKDAKDLRALMHAPLFVTPGAKLSDLLKMLQKNKTHMAIVSDEYGGTMGLITMEDILEQLVGEIYDEHDEVYEPVRYLPGGACLVDGGADLDDVREALGYNGESDAVTAGGWVVEQIERIPAVGDSFTQNGRLITVTQADATHVLQISVRPAESQDGAPQMTSTDQRRNDT